MRSSLTLGIVFIGLAALCVFASPGTRLTPVGIGLAAFLTVAGVLAMARLRAAFYVGLLAGAAVAIAGIVTWSGIGAGRFTLPVDPRVEVVLGLFLCFRVVVGSKQLGAPRRPARRLLSDEVEEND